MCEDGIEKSVPHNHRLSSSRVMPNGDQEGQIFLSHREGQIFLSHPHIHDGFLYAFISQETVDCPRILTQVLAIVNSELFTRILFSGIALKDIFVKLEIQDCH